METSTGTNALISAALVKAQREIGKAAKTSDNPFYKSKYADLETVIDAVKGPLNNHGIAITQEIRIINAADSVKNVLCTTLRHESGELIRSEALLPEQKDIQKWGAAVSYTKRYCLQALLLLPTEDDDGNSLVEKPPVRKASPRKIGR
jgi:hypothetical protein